MGDETKYIIPNLKTSCQIIEFISDNDRGFTISEIAKELSIPRTRSCGFSRLWSLKIL